MSPFAHEPEEARFPTSMAAIEARLHFLTDASEQAEQRKDLVNDRTIIRELEMLARNTEALTSHCMLITQGRDGFARHRTQPIQIAG